MKKIVFAAMALSLAACSPKETVTKVTADFTNEVESVIVRTKALASDAEAKVDTIALTNGHLEYNAASESLSRLSIRNADSYKSVSAILVPGMPLVVNGELGGECSLTGSPLYEAIDQALSVEPTEEAVRGYIEEHLSDDAVLAILDRYAVIYEDYREQLAEPVKTGVLADLYNSLEERYNEDVRRRNLQESFRTGTVDAPDFTLKGLDGNDITLSSLKGKYLLLDFWGSWCVWCIRGIPELKEYYAQYGSKLEIVGIDNNDSEEAWKNAVKEHELPWTHVKNERETSVLNDYAVEGFPTYVLINPEGKVVDYAVGADPEFFKRMVETLR